MLQKYEPGAVYQLPLPRRGDLLAEIEQAVDECDIQAGTLQFIGAVYKARVGYFNIETDAYVITDVNEFAEIACGMGTISHRDGKPMAHVHVVLAGASGRIYAGHLMPESSIFVTELTLQGYKGKPQERRLDPETGLYLW